MKRHVFATAETVALLVDAVDQVRESFTGTTPLAIGHASRKGGGRLRPHVSHQSGRDVDAAYYVKAPEDPPRWQVTNKRNLDAPRTWRLFEALLATGRVEYLFVDYRIQRELHRHAKAAGVANSRLATVFQYPRGRSHRRGLIRHEVGHKDHFHIRFHCPLGDTACRPR
jgi:murein endopeptidase